MQWFEAADMPHWRKGFPSRRRDYRGKYGFWIEVIETPYSIHATIFSSYWAFRKGDGEGELWESRDERGVSSFAAWDKRAAAMDSKLKKALEKARQANKPKEADDTSFSKSHPLLCGLMTCVEGEEKGKAREPSTLFIFTGDGLWKACLAEKEANATLWGSSATFQGLLDALERSLASDNPDWRVKSEKGAYTTAKPRVKGGS